ncbi:MAG TPA: NAD(P)H-dependent oxidoreductase subunit E [Spirochaetia bacterium]|nr:NAD(P)H-dependent oxidoreductase subunit E [Spirochaetia bacterium]
MTVAEIVDSRGNSRENLLQILHDLQDASGDHSLHPAELQELSAVMDIPVADIVGTASFYTMFSFRPRGRHVIRLCESPPCWVMGEEDLRSALEARLGITVGQTTPDGQFTLETSSCLGTCGVAPVMSIDDEVYGNLTAEKVARILERIAAQERV